MKSYNFLLILIIFSLGSVKILSQTEICGTLNPQTPVPLDLSYQLSNPIGIPVFFHIILSSSGEGNVNDSQLNDQITILNQRYSDTFFSFYLAGVTRTKNDNWRGLSQPDINGTDINEINMKNYLAVDPEHVLNIYIDSIKTSAFAWGRFPWDPFPNLYGIVMRTGILPNGYQTNFNLGITAVHETGHCLGLVHTFFAPPTPCKPNIDPDSCEDTPPHLVNRGTPPDYTNTCPSPGLDPVHNYMNYTYEIWRNEFTEDQKIRMRSKVAQEKINLGGNNIYLNASRTINSGDSWEIFSGNYFFSNGTSLIVNGILNVQGTSSNPVTFDFISKDVSEQNGIKVNTGGSIDISHAIIKNAYRGIYVDESEAEINNCEIKDCWYGIYLYRTNYGPSQPNINNVHSHDNDNSGIALYYSSPRILDSEFDDNHYGINCQDYSSPELGYAGTYGNNNIHNNFYGLFAHSNSNPFLGRQTCIIQGGNNKIAYNGPYNARVLSNSTVIAEQNYWGANPPQSSLIYADGTSSIDYTPWLVSSPFKMVPNFKSRPADRSKSPEEYVFNNAFGNSASVDTSKPNSFDPKWPLFWKILYARNLVDVGKYSFAQKICKNIINEYPDSSLSFYALDLLWKASQENDEESFKSYLTTIKNKRIIKNLYGSAEIILSGYDNANRISSLNNLANQYSSKVIGAAALFNKFLYYINEQKNIEMARAVSNQLDDKYPNSSAAIDAHLQLGDKVKNVIISKSGNVEKLLSEDNMPKKYTLLGNYPNPFNPSTKIRYALPFDSDVEITIYNITGQIVKTFKYGSQSAGLYDVKWNGTNSNGELVSSGIYLYHFKAISLEKNNEVFEKSAKLILMK